MRRTVDGITFTQSGTTWHSSYGPVYLAHTRQGTRYAIEPAYEAGRTNVGPLFVDFVNAARYLVERARRKDNKSHD